MTAEQLSKVIVDAGIMPADELQAYWGFVACRKDLARLIVNRGTLPDVQAKQLLAGLGAASSLN